MVFLFQLIHLATENHNIYIALPFNKLKILGKNLKNKKNESTIDTRNFYFLLTFSINDIIFQ